MEVVKKDHSGVMREFVVSQLEDFIEEGMQVDDFLTIAERQNIVRHELENIRATNDDKHVPAYHHINIYPGKSLLQTFIRAGIIEKVYTLHDEEILRKLGSKWFMALFQKQPYGKFLLKFILNRFIFQSFFVSFFRGNSSLFWRSNSIIFYFSWILYYSVIDTHGSWFSSTFC